MKFFHAEAIESPPSLQQKIHTGAELSGGRTQEVRGQDIVLDRLGGIGFHHRHVLVRGRVHDDLRQIGREEGADPRPLSHVGHHRRDRQAGIRPAQFLIDVAVVI